MFIARKLGCSYSNIDIPFHEKFIILNRFKPGKRIRTDSTVLWIGNTPKLKWAITQNTLANVFVTKFDYLLYWDITGAPRHIAGQALFCVNIGNEWNNVCNNCFNYSYLYWVKWRLFWINSDFELQIYQVTYRILVLLYYTLFRRWDLFRRSCLQVLATGWVDPIVLLRQRERSLEGKTHIDRYEQCQSSYINSRQYCHCMFDIFILIIEIIRVKYISLEIRQSLQSSYE